MDYLISRPTWDYRNNPDYIENPDLSAVVNVPKIYWKIVNNKPVEMTQPEKDVVDAKIEADKRYNLKSKDDIMKELFAAIEPFQEDTSEQIQLKNERKVRFAQATMTPYWQFLHLHLDQNDYTNARARCQELLNAGVIIQSDYDLFSYILPLVR